MRRSRGREGTAAFNDEGEDVVRLRGAQIVDVAQLAAGQRPLRVIGEDEIDGVAAGGHGGSVEERSAVVGAPEHEVAGVVFDAHRAYQRQHVQRDGVDVNALPERRDGQDDGAGLQRDGVSLPRRRFLDDEGHFHALDGAASGVDHGQVVRAGVAVDGAADLQGVVIETEEAVEIVGVGSAGRPGVAVRGDAAEG